ncbi:hypothetical protein C8Q77DRAFT_832655 [Trametes polyzona]|nr:hypothetical protein C8Q77DRAFT_832655 [Trametes polyzona]
MHGRQASNDTRSFLPIPIRQLSMPVRPPYPPCFPPTEPPAEVPCAAYGMEANLSPCRGTATWAKWRMLCLASSWQLNRSSYLADAPTMRVTLGAALRQSVLHSNIDYGRLPTRLPCGASPSASAGPSRLHAYVVPAEVYICVLSRRRNPLDLGVLAPDLEAGSALEGPGERPQGPRGSSRQSTKTGRRLRTGRHTVVRALRSSRSEALNAVCAVRAGYNCTTDPQ